MAFVSPTYSRGQVSAAGRFFATPMEEGKFDLETYAMASAVLNNFRAAHLYPINTFQATLRNRLKKIDKKALVGQRLKRLPSILAKLAKNPDM